MVACTTTSSAATGRVQSRDARFDGWFFTAVTTTGIYCRPSCPAITPKRAERPLLPDRRGRPAARLPGLQALPARRLARVAGVERPGRPRRSGHAAHRRRRRRPRRRAPGSPPGSATASATSPASSPPSSAPARSRSPGRSGPRRPGSSSRRRDLPFTEVAFAAGFASIRQFNDTVRDGVRRHADRAAAPGGASPDADRRRRGDLAAPAVPRARSTPTSLFDVPRRCGPCPGVEEWDGRPTGARSRLPHGLGVVALTPADRPRRAARCGSTTSATSAAAVQRCRRLLDLDADPRRRRRAARPRPAARAARRRRRPAAGRPGTSTATSSRCGPCSASRSPSPGPARIAGRLVARGRHAAAPTPTATLTHALPHRRRRSPRLDPAQLADARCAATATLLRAVRRARRRRRRDRPRRRSRRARAPSSLALPGIGPWTAAYIAMRALGDPDVFLPTDLGVRHALERLGLDRRPRERSPPSPNAGGRGARTRSTTSGPAWKDHADRTHPRTATNASPRR